MSFYQEVLEEIKQIDHYVQERFRIIKVEEDLSGMRLELLAPDSTDNDNLIRLHILTAEARTHLANLLIRQYEREKEES